MVVKTIFNELYQALNMKKIMKKIHQEYFNFHVSVALNGSLLEI
jgi:predicted translin family RNA/ssDNA-binding protein